MQKKLERLRALKGEEDTPQYQ
ncbi:uncharacterized, partial [Tachysurus ichikawai]